LILDTAVGLVVCLGPDSEITVLVSLCMPVYCRLEYSREQLTVSLVRVLFHWFVRVPPCPPTASSISFFSGYGTCDRGNSPFVPPYKAGSKAGVNTPGRGHEGSSSPFLCHSLYIL
jgi:hypothetical protein